VIRDDPRFHAMRNRKEEANSARWGRGNKEEVHCIVRRGGVWEIREDYRKEKSLQLEISPSGRSREFAFTAGGLWDGRGEHRGCDLNRKGKIGGSRV